MKIILIVIFTAIMLYAFWVPTVGEGLIILGGSYISAGFIAGLYRVKISWFFQKNRPPK